MLTMKVEGTAGSDLRKEMLPEMVVLAHRVGIRIECNANETKFWVDPADTIGSIQEAYDRLYPDSRLVASWIKQPVRRAT